MSVYNVGLDIGSTTVKLVILDEKNNLIYGKYERHYSDVRNSVKKIISEGKDILKDKQVTMMITGSGGLSLAEWLGVSFVQEVVASTKCIETIVPETDVVIELGGEDAKIIYFQGSLEQRMNSICAGGTGAFIDQMSSLLETDAGGLNALAKEHKNIYSIASRCGVFAKTDVQALINQGAKKEDIAASVLQSVVNQTISNLACGRPIRGKVAFLGGPLYFLEELRNRFIETLHLKDDEVIFPKNSQLFVAMGAAICSRDIDLVDYNTILTNIDKKVEDTNQQIDLIEPLFKNQEEYEVFKKRHDKNRIEKIDPSNYFGKAYLGIDAGSTTTKAVLLSEENEILYSFYGNNKGKPLDQAIKILKEIYKDLDHIEIVSSCVTGYGENLLKAGLNMDFGEVETVAHFKGASLFNKDVDFILDIGGQDMKSIRIKDGVINDILLNEACSSGCGSFIETFAKSINMDVGDFLERGLFAEKPVDLGSRCTVFMNSMVKQAQKEGASVGDISAGLANSIIRNAIQKVIKIRDPQDLGENIVVQGGTFYGDAVLRAFETISQREVVRSNEPGLMGAIGAAIIAKERSIGKTSLIGPDEITSFSYTTKNARCHRCGNNCMLTINNFSNDSRFITGNRCEKGAGVIVEDKDRLPNLYDYRYKRTFDYPELEGPDIKGVVGIPRVLNIYENYPFWHSFFTELGFKVQLSRKSSREVYEMGLESIPSETACYPAKISHGHIMDLISRDIDFIFYPSVFYEEKEDKASDNHLNCPVVVGYPELIKHNVPYISEGHIEFINPFISFDDRKSLENNLYLSLKNKGIKKRDVKLAVARGLDEMENYKRDLRKKGQDTIDFLKKSGKKGIVLAGRPYHVDPAINHGIPELINSLGMAVLTEDSIDHLGSIDDGLRVLDQWTYHSRLYRAADYVSQVDFLELVQLNSFGCGLDAVTTDQVEEILKSRNKIYTHLKIDEISNLGAVTIRLRSLEAALKERELKGISLNTKKEQLYKERISFTEEHRQNHTILMPQMAPIQFALLEKVLKDSGYNLVLLDDNINEAINQGLRYVNNDACYPSIVVIGQFIAALKSGKYDVENTSLIISQTGGVCRASNYTGFLRKALKESGFEDVPVLSVSVQGIEKNPGFNITYGMVNKLVYGLLLGDLLSRVSLATRPYEIEQGESDHLLNNWIDKINSNSTSMNKKLFVEYTRDIVKEFEAIEITDIKKPKVGIVGEILVKYHPNANNELVKILEEEGAEAVLSDVTDFMMYCLYNSSFKSKELGKPYKGKLVGDIGIKYIEYYRKYTRQALDNSQRFSSPLKIEELAALAEQMISLGNQSGEGWLLTAEMIELIEMGAENVICVQPFGCLPNHITGKGMIKGIRDLYPNANITPIDYDPGASTVNQLNRIKLMLSKAKDNLKEKNL